MSYSRWDNPRGSWYAIREENSLNLIGVCRISAKEIEEDIDACIEKVKITGGEHHELREYVFLREIMERFLKDIKGKRLTLG